MSNFNILSALTAVSLAAAILFFFYPQIIVPLPYGLFTFLLVMIVCFWMASRLKMAHPETMPPEVSGRLATLRNYFFVMGLFFFFDGIAHVGLPALYPHDITASHMHTFSHIFFFVGNAMIIRIPVSFINPRWVNPSSWLMAILGVVAVAWRVINTDKLVYIFGPNQTPIIVTDTASGALFLVANVIGLLIPGLYLIWRGLKSGNSLVRTGAILLGLGMAVFFSIGPIINLIQNQYTQLIIHLLLALSFFFMGASAFYKEKEATSEI